MQDTIIRKVDSSNAHEISEIEKKCFSAPWSEKYINEFLSEEFNVCFAAFSSLDDKITGYICMCIMDYEAEIENIAVCEEFRRSGIASFLLKHAISVVENRGIKKLMLEVRQSNTPALNLYKKFGFYEVGTRKNYYTRPKENAILMDKITDC